SPIAEALTGIMDRADFQKSISSRKLVLVSDLLQNSSTYSFYRQSATWDSYQNSASGEAIPDMHGVVVVARIVPRRHYNLPITRLKTFWSRYFEAAGAVFEPVN
ncbi:MAG: hypothetical protein KIT00_07160, partial [Rhodospirillales bacterium]|nr:hypothetical protein [Rhodospirillales bacterium]